MINRTPIFDAVKRLRRGVPFTQGEVLMLDLAIDEALGILPEHKILKPLLFYAAVRKIVGGSLNQIQVDSIENLVEGAIHWRVSWLAYALATAWHEARFEPQPEWGRGKGRQYGLPGKYGQPQYGRGLIQLTWDRNYEWADQALGLQGKLLHNFDLALDPEIAAQILLKGMEEGAFCPGQSLAAHLPDVIGKREQFVSARRIVNGTDKAGMIADYALRFQDAAIEGGWNG